MSTPNTYATEAFAEDAAADAAAAVVDAAPGTLDTLNELAAALGDDANFATTVTTALAGKQPLDSDLTAIAALTTTSYGRAFLELANAAAGLTALGLDADLSTFSLPASTTISAFGASLVDDAAASNARTTLGLGTAATSATGDFQPIDSDLTAIAALTTTAFGRGLLELANAAAAIAALGLDADLATLSLPASTTISAFGASLIDDAAASNARTTLGLGTAATSSTGDFDAAGAAAAAQAASQPLDADLTTLAGLTPTTDNIIQSVAGAWASRTPAQVRTALALVIGTNVQAWDADLDTIAGLTATTDNLIQSVAGVWASRTPAQLKATLALAKGDVGLGNVDNTSDATKDAASTTLTNKTLTSPTIGGSIISALNWQPSGRLTLTTAVPVTTTDVTAATTVYYTPYRGNLVPLWNGTAWTTIPFAQKSLSLAGLTADSNYDIFGYLSSGDLALEALIWSTATARATEVALTDGFYTKSGDQTRIYLGTIRITAAGGACDDNRTKRYVWNNYNRVLRAMVRSDSTVHTYASATVRQWNNDTANQINFVLGVLEDGIPVGFIAELNSGVVAQSATVRAVIDSLTSQSGCIQGGAIVSQIINRMRIGNAGTCNLTTIALPGYHYIALNEQASVTPLANTCDFQSASVYTSIMG